MKFLMTARKKDGDIMNAVFEADDEAQARELIQEADGTLELISLQPVTATDEASSSADEATSSADEASAPATSTPSGSSRTSYGKPAGCLGSGAILFIVIKILFFGMRCAQDPVMKKQPQPFVPRPVPGERQPADPLPQQQALKRLIQHNAESSKLDDVVPALHQRMQQTDDDEVRNNCRHALDEIAKLKALPLNASDEEWEKQSQATRKAIAAAIPRNSMPKSTAKTNSGTAKK